MNSCKDKASSTYLIDSSPNSCVNSQAGYALPSVLMLVTVLTLVAFSVLALHYLQRRQVLFEIEGVKAEAAAQSGVAVTLAHVTSSSALLSSLNGSNEVLQFEDGTRAHVSTQRWGFYLLVRSEGISHNVISNRLALAGLRPAPAFENALIMGNVVHQLVLTGTTRITGNVIVGTPGVTTGSLHDLQTPISIPVNGRVSKSSSSQIPQFASDIVVQAVAGMTDLIRQSTGSSTPSESAKSIILPPGTNLQLVSDSIDVVIVHGPLFVSAVITRREHPLYLISTGVTIILPESRLKGLIAIASKERVVLQPGALIDQAILYSEESVIVQGGVSVSGQFIAPTISVDSTTTLSYPSILVSVGSVNSPDTIGQKITIAGSARVEGFIGLISSSIAAKESDIVTLRPRATIVGSLLSESTMTLDGTVMGSVMTKDFSFYVAPTKYVGWLRSGIIDRSGLPPGYLLPTLFAGLVQLDIMEWL